jgi:hypothetical protein
MSAKIIQCAICLDTNNDEFVPHACLKHCFHRKCLSNVRDPKCPVCRQLQPLRPPPQNSVHWTENTPTQEARTLLLQAANKLQDDLLNFNAMDNHLPNALISLCSSFYRAHINNIMDKLEKKLNH